MSTITWHQVSNDVYGNPRYVCDYFYLLRESDRAKSADLSVRYALAVKNANQFCGRKFHNKQYGGGIVFSTYDLDRLEKSILEFTK